MTASLPQPLQTVVPSTTPDRSAALQMLSDLVSAQAAAHAAYPEALPPREGNKPAADLPEGMSGQGA